MGRHKGEEKERERCGWGGCCCVVGKAKGEGVVVKRARSTINKRTAQQFSNKQEVIEGMHTLVIF